MALVSSSSQLDRYSVAANELQDHILDVYGNKENEIELFRYKSDCLGVYQIDY